MATVALFAVGSAIGGPVGGVIGGVIGSYLDNTVILPAIFGRNKGLQGSRLTEVNISGSEGNPMPFSLGNKAIVDGQIIDKSEIIEEKTEEEQGGKGGGGATSTSYKYFMHLAVSWGETYPVGIDKILTIWANGKVIYSNDTADASLMQSCTNYTGSEAQTPNSLLESLHGGAGTVPAYRGEAYSVFERLGLLSFGNAIPTFRALMQCQNGISVREAILRIHERWGVARSKVDVSRIRECLRGISISGPISANQLLDSIMQAYRITRRESNGKIVFRHRGDEDRVDIEAADLGVVTSDQYEPAITIKDSKLFDLPTHCDVTFVDPDADDQRGSVSARRVSSGTRTNRTVNLPLVISSDLAKRVARSELFLELVERQEVRFALPPKYLHLEENDLARVTYKGRTYLIRITQVERGANWQIVCEGTLVEDQVWQGGLTSDVASSGVGNVYTAPALAWEVLDLPPLSNDHALSLGFYSVACAELPSAKWLGANLYGSADDLAWSFASRRADESIVGKATGTLASGPVGVWDRGNSVGVEMFEGELSSVAEVDVLNGSNWILLGDEIVGFATATLTGTSGAGGKLYTLSNLVRGLRDTAGAIGAHATNERAVRLTSTGVDFNVAAITLLGTSRKFRAVPTGATIASQTSKTMTVSGRTLRPFAVADVRGSRDASNNLAVTWKPRSRALVRLFQAAPALDDQSEYDVVVKLAGSPVRTERVSGAETWSYSAANQTADGITPGSPVSLEIYQISETVGRGTVAAATV